MAVQFDFKNRYDMQDLLQIMRILRSPDGCPWDREQTHRSIRGDFLEETHEALEAIDQGDSDGLQEELGDVLLQVVFHACIEEEADGFTFEDVVDALCQKLVMRHPHVFGDLSAADAGQALKNWDAVKRQAKGGKTQSQLLDGVPHSLPALMRASKVLGRARRVGFEMTSDVLQTVALLEEQLSVFKQAIVGEADVAEQLGDMLFSMTALARQLSLDAEEQLSLAANRFVGRFFRMERLLAERNMDVSAVSADGWRALWEETSVNDL